jgi:hypothetical protein
MRFEQRMGHGRRERERTMGQLLAELAEGRGARFRCRLASEKSARSSVLSLYEFPPPLVDKGQAGFEFAFLAFTALCFGAQSSQRFRLAAH